MGLPQTTDLFGLKVGATQGVAGSGTHHSVTWGEMLEATENHLQPGSPNGVATLDQTGIVPTSQLPTPEIGGFGLEITAAQENDVLQLKTAKWRNTQQDNLVDGGNF